ncbi:histidine kinase [Thauera sinica]|uniref:Sensor protein n=1 Tax=Thauera sinica TaxID=2665146 RepID=A0ABW1AN49_9RHOO|nr:histidine kinase [Thauera sp. K11]ATE61789.1 nitrate/nitrite two-component system sensor histidine kinase [Thauera sp. K11]
MGLMLPRWLVRHSILLVVALALIALALIGLAGMSASVMVAEGMRGSASAINVAGSLRRLTHRVAGLVATDALGGGLSGERVHGAIDDFERGLAHPALQRAVQRNPGGLFAATYRGIDVTWHTSLRPRLEATMGEKAPMAQENVEKLLVEVDLFVGQLDTLVTVLEQDTEARIADLKQILAAAIAAILVVIALALLMLHRSVHRPLVDLLRAAQGIARGNFSARVTHVGYDELGRVGATFNLMANEMSRQYQTLEQRVADKTAALQRSNRSLELLYHAIARLYQTPTAPEAYEATLRDIEQIAGLASSFVCIEPRHDGPATVIASTLGACPERLALGDAACGACRASAHPLRIDPPAREAELLRIPLRDREYHYGMLRLTLPAGARLEDWQFQLVEALTRHIGMALGAARRGEQERLLALQEERSVIARELHDSLAQALSYMKIQVSLLQPLLGDPARAAEAAAVLADLREGIGAAYRQLRELLVSFRLELSGDFPTLLREAVQEHAARGGVQVELSTRLADCGLSPNQEVHVLQIVREALSNMVRHANARRASVSLSCGPGGEVGVVIEDDGVGLGGSPADPWQHHGLAIMRERARGLGGTLEISPRPGGGTRVGLRFIASHHAPAPLPPALENPLR